jgi:uncharacterized membrane protein
MEYVVAKWVHILSSTVLFGAGAGSAFHLLMATLRRDSAAVAAVSRVVVIADWVFTTPTVILQPLSGYYLLRLLGTPLTSEWVWWSMWLYGYAIACWLPVVWLQIRMRDMAQAAALAHAPLPASYWRCFAAWVALGIGALLAFLTIFYLMVAKPQ